MTNNAIQAGASALKLLAMFILGLAWLVPNHYPPWTSFYNETCAALALLLLVAALGRPNWGRALPMPIWFVMAAAAVPWLQWAAGLLAFSGDAIVGSLYLVGLAAAIAAGHVWASQDRRQPTTTVFAAVVPAAIVSSLLGLLQVLDVSGFGIWAEAPYAGMRAVANLGQPNNLATLIGFGLLGVLHLRERPRIAPFAAGLLAVFLIAGAAATQSRTALLFGPAVMLGLSLAVRRGVVFATSRWTVAGLVALHWSLTLAWPMVRAVVFPLPPEEAVSRLTTGSLRTAMWPVLLDASIQSPWLGFGWLQVGAAQLSVADAHPAAPEFWMHAHNLFLDLVLWCGYPLGLMLSGAVLWWYVSRARRVDTLESVMAFLAITLFGIHAMLELPHHYAYFLIPVGLWIGQVEAQTAAPSAVPPRWNLLAPVLGLLMLIGIWRDYSAIEEDFRLVRFENLRIGSVRATEPAPDAPFMSGLTSFLRFSRTEPHAGMREEDLHFMADVARRYPYAPSLYRLARALALNGQFDEAVRTLRRLQHMHGDGNLLRVRANLRDRIAEGEHGLAPLERAIDGLELTEPMPMPRATTTIP